jgi:hypothetical protein
MTEQLYEILPGFPQSQERILEFGGQPHYSEGFIVRFRRPDGASWIGNFRRGQTDLNGVYPLSSNSQIMVFADGNGYLLDLGTEKLVREVGHGYCQNVVPSVDGKIVISNLTQIIVIESAGEIWVSERISWDGIKDLRVDGSVVSGMAYDPTNKNKEWVEFSVDLQSHAIKGGSYRL